MASVISNTRLELLSKDNYDTWTMQVEALLTRCDLWEYVIGTIVKPELVTGPNEATLNEARMAWDKRDQKAKAELILAIHPSELKQIRGCETSREVWLKLESIYASKGPAKKATLLKRLIMQKLEEGGDVREHINKFFDAVDKLESMQVKINGDLLSIMLLYSLPVSFENFRCAIESRDELPTAEVLKVKIVEESEARKHASGEVTVDVWNAVKSANKTKWPKNNNNMNNNYTNNNNNDKSKKMKCYRCGKVGHIASKCYSRKSSGNQQSSQPTANNVDETYAVFHTVEDGEKSSCMNREWILDSGCTAHLCGDLNLFKSLSGPTNCKLNLANQASTIVKGKGVVNINAMCEKGSRLIEF